MEYIELIDCGVVFECDSRATRSGFAHDATIIIDGRRENTSHCYYLNRTWEAWRFQSVCLCCVSALIEERTEELRETYRLNHGITRICGENRKKDVQKMLDSDIRLFRLHEIKTILREGGPNLIIR